VKRLYRMVLIRDGRELNRVTAAVDLELAPPDPKLRQLLLDAVERAHGKPEDVGRYELSLRDQTGRELLRYADTKDG
jgi:hypothetical protein